jgi:hypothetical protein
MLCEYGCGQEAKYTLKNGKLSCVEYPVRSCPEMIKKRTSPLKGRSFPERNKKISESLKGRKLSAKHIKNLSLSHIGIQAKENHPRWGKKHSEETKSKWKFKRRGKKIQTQEYKDRLRNEMLNGKAAWMNKFIKNPSKPEVMLRDIVKEIYPNCEFQYQVLNYALDVAIPNYKIAIEFDGWYHFDTQEHINYHKKRQREIEERGWQFI